MSRDDSLQATTEGVKGKRAQQEGSIREKLLRILLGVATKKRNVVPDGVEHAVRTNNRWHLPRPHHSQQRVELMQQWLVTPANRYSHHRTLRPMSHPQLLSCKSFAQQSCSMQLGLSHSATMSHKKKLTKLTGRFLFMPQRCSVWPPQLHATTVSRDETVRQNCSVTMA